MTDSVPTVISFHYAGDAPDVVRRVLNWEEVGRYICGIDLADHRHKTFRKDRVATYLDGAAQWLVEPYSGPPAVIARALPDGRPHVLFTGFDGAVRDELEAKAAAAGMSVRATVTKGLLYLVGGSRAGRTKLEKARAQECFILDEAQFHTLLETGEVPDRVDA